MAHSVKCKYCQKTFDRDKIAFVQVSSKRYAHADCYLREKVKDANIPELEIIDPTDIVKCFACGKEINKKKDKYKQFSKGKFAHLECAEIEDKREKTDAERLDAYIMHLFGWEFVHPRVRKQINDYINDYDFSYSGIQKSLEYFYEKKGNSIEKAHGGIGIVPYVYKDAYNYYYALWEAQQKNEDIIVEQYKPKIIEITIPVPERKIKTRKLFSFLDEEV